MFSRLKFDEIDESGIKITPGAFSSRKWRKTGEKPDFRQISLWPRRLSIFFGKNFLLILQPVDSLTSLRSPIFEKKFS